MIGKSPMSSHGTNKPPNYKSVGDANNKNNLRSRERRRRQGASPLEAFRGRERERRKQQEQCMPLEEERERDAFCVVFIEKTVLCGLPIKERANIFVSL